MALEYRQGSRSTGQLEADVREFWAAVSTDPALRAKIPLDDAELEQAEEHDSISFSTRGAGLDPATATVIVGFGGPIAAEVLKSIWTETILPWIRRRRGHDTLNDNRDDRE